MEAIKCMEIEDKDKAYTCAQEAIREDTGACRPRFVLVIEDEGCDPCAEALRNWDEEIKKSRISVVKVDSDEGKDILSKNNLDYVPGLFLLDCNNNIIA